MLEKRWHRWLSLDFRPPWWPTKRFIGVSLHLMGRCFVFPQVWGATDYIRIVDYPGGAILTRYVYWQWLWFQMRIEPRVVGSGKED